MKGTLLKHKSGVNYKIKYTDGTEIVKNIDILALQTLLANDRKNKENGKTVPFISGYVRV